MHFCALRGFRVCSQIRTDETVEMFTKLWYNVSKKGDDLYEIIQSRNDITINLLFMLFSGCDMYAFVHRILYINIWGNMF